MSQREEAGKIFVGGLSWDTDLETLQSYFGQYGEIIDSIVMKNPQTGKSRGFGFVTFKDPSAVDVILSTKDHSIDGRTVDAKACNARGTTAPKSNRGYGGGGGGGGGKTSKIFVGGLPGNIDEDGIKEAFARFGNVTEVVIMFDHEKNRSRGFGFLTFDNEDSVEQACSEHYVDVNGKQVECKKAEPRGGGGGGRGGGSGGRGGGRGGGNGGGYGGQQQQWGQQGGQQWGQQAWGQDYSQQQQQQPAWGQQAAAWGQQGYGNGWQGQGQATDVSAQQGMGGYGAWNQAQGQGQQQQGYGGYGQFQQGYGAQQPQGDGQQAASYGYAGYDAAQGYGAQQAGGYGSQQASGYGAQAGYGQNGASIGGGYQQRQAPGNQGGGRGGSSQGYHPYSR